MLSKIIILVVLISYCNGQYFILNNHFSEMKQVFSWNQIGYNFDGVKYVKDEPLQKIVGRIFFIEEPEENERFFVQYNNIPIGFEVFQDKVFITVPRRRYGIPSTLNYVELKSSESSSPLLKPYPNADSINNFVSVYRPRVDACERLWMVDTGLLEVPDNFVQKRPPHIIVYDLKTDKEVLRYEIPSDVLVNGTTSGLTSITVDVTPSTCDDAYAYINDLARNGLIVFSMKQLDSWRISHSSFVYDVGATDFRVAQQTINWRDGIFSIALSDPDNTGKRTAYYHPLVSTQEFSVSNEVLKDKNADFEAGFKLEGVRGAFSQSGSHDFHSITQTLLYANVAQDAIMCWNTRAPLTSKNAAPVAQSHSKLVYISGKPPGPTIRVMANLNRDVFKGRDLKVVGNDVWVLVNQIPTFIYSQFNVTEPNFFVLIGNVQDLIKGTVCNK